MKFTNKNNYLFLFNLSFNVVFYKILSYFAKPNFIVYDEWFDDDLEKTKNVLEKSKIKTISNIHEFFYDQSNYKVGASENNLKLDIHENKDELFNNYYFENNSEIYDSLSNKKFLFFGKIIKNKLNFNIKNKIIYTLSIFGFVIILGLLLFFISQSKKNESTITNKSILKKKRKLFLLVNFINHVYKSSLIVKYLFNVILKISMPIVV